jgi:hypothetical protein
MEKKDDRTAENVAAKEKMSIFSSVRFWCCIWGMASTAIGKQSTE